MFSFKSFRRNCLIRLMTVLGFGGMVGFCIASCQSPKTNQNQQPEQESPEKVDSIQPETATNQADSNKNQQPEQKSPENIDSVQPESQTETQADNPSPTKPDTVEDKQQITDSIPNDTKKTDKDDNIDFIMPRKAYGIRRPKELPQPPKTDKQTEAK